MLPDFQPQYSLTPNRPVRTLLLVHPSMPKSRREFRRNIRRISLQSFRLAFALSLAIMLAASGWAQTSPQVSLETNETLFTVLTAINTCGYDQELNVSDPLRTQIRSEVAKAVENTDKA